MCEPERDPFFYFDSKAIGFDIYGKALCCKHDNTGASHTPVYIVDKHNKTQLLH